MSTPITSYAIESEKESLATRWAESGRIPDNILRMGIRRQCAQRLKDERKGGSDAVFERQQAWLEGLRTSDIALETRTVNRPQHELPPEFFQLCLGKHLKYSSCYWDEATTSLNMAEEHMMRLYAERAELGDGQRILELGCGWGSLTLWMAKQFPNARITAVSNSRAQREFIEARCLERAIFNVEVITSDVNKLRLQEASYDRVVSVEMFEHMRSYQELLKRIGNWLVPGGKLFVHLFCHRELLYLFEATSEGNWMGRHFFTGGLMPSADTLLHFQDVISIEQRWLLSGTHYEKTANAWLQNQDNNREQVMRVLQGVYGMADAAVWYQRWRMFWMACAELFGFDNGNEWMVAHYRFKR